jgi:hypothetical protein
MILLSSNWPTSHCVAESDSFQISVTHPATPLLLVQDDIWYFDTPVGTLRVYFGNGVVSEVHPSNLRLGRVPLR